MSTSPTGRTFEDDADLVRSLVHKHLGHLEHKGGVYPSDLRANERLMSVRDPLYFALTARNTEALLDRLKVNASDAYRRKFRDVAITLQMGRAMKRAAGERLDKFVTVSEVAARIRQEAE